MLPGYTLTSGNFRVVEVTVRYFAIARRPKRSQLKAGTGPFAGERSKEISKKVYGRGHSDAGGPATCFQKLPFPKSNTAEDTLRSRRHEDPAPRLEIMSPLSRTYEVR